MLRMLFQPRIKDLRYFLVLGEKARNDAATTVVNLHARGKRLHAPQNKPAFERRKNRPRGLLQKRQLVRVLLASAADNSAETVAMSVEELRGRVHNKIGTQRQRPLEIRGHKSVVND